MSSKKKKITSECEKCNCVVLVKDLDKHLENCDKLSQDNISQTPKKSPSEDEKEIPILKFNCYLYGYNVKINKKNEDLPPEFYGWYKKHAILLNKETMNFLGIFPRQALSLLLPNGEYIIGYAWPWKEVPLLKISTSLIKNDEFVKVFVMNEIRKLDSIVFDVISEKKELFKSKAFLNYIRVYFSMAFLSPYSNIEVNYLGQKIILKMRKNLIDSFNSVNFNEVVCKINEVYTLNDKCLITIEGNIDEIVDKELDSFEKNNKRDGMDRLGGMVKAKKDIYNFILKPLENGKQVSSVIIHGITGTGKSLLLKILNNIMGTRSVFIGTSKEFTGNFSLLTDKNSIVLIDNFDSWMQNDSNKTTCNLITEYLDNKTHGAIIIALRDIDSLDLHIRRRFSLEIEMPVPTFDERKDIMDVLLNSKEKEFVDVNEFAHQTHGFTGSDLMAVCEMSRQNNSESSEEFLEFIKRVRPTGIRQFIFEVPNVSWDDIGGNEQLKEEIQQAVIWPQKHADAFTRFGVDPPSGILLYGPPGCSKTLIARALASQSRLNFLSVKGPELFSKYVGESEKAVRDLFHRARQVAPTILFFDEIDAVGGKRGVDKSSPVGDRVLAQLLTELDGLEKKSRVVVLAATNRPDTIDSALLRPGRLDRSIYVPLPDFNTREQIIKLRLNRMQLGEDVNIHNLSTLTEGYSGAEIVAFCQVAALKAMRENLNSGIVEQKHFDASIKEVIPRTDKELLKCYQSFLKGDY
ncbi:Transitional endoplasmic reticulum ATPase [Strongyloides ratti]|uniref:Transitional endoplasmic reticulum ATPase n=1 Tax=Strongyloides ratti TaxID=34506 RepID=A0A090LGZ5_STRRB|nr:Transitional endoplasmic reticulum ATPase [Strongyloides ratti]CEF66735.1 Transitional endoplasmic reticulum ATPase [Strongyloides ratti]